MTPQKPNTVRTINLTHSKNEGKQNPYESLATAPTRPTPMRITRPEAERLLTFAAFLPLSDELVVRELLASGRTIAHVSRLLGESRHRVRSRVNRLLARTSDPAFRYVVSRRIRFDAPSDPRAWRTTPQLAWPDDWSAPMRTAAQLCILDGRSCRDASRHAGVSYHVLRRQVTTLRELGRIWRGAIALREAS